MKLLVKLYLRSFLFHAVIFGILLTLWEYIEGEEINMWKQVLKSIVFGGLMSWSTVTTQRRTIKELSKEPLTEDDFKIHQSEIVTTGKSIPEIYDLLKANETTNKWKLEMQASKIIGKVKDSWFSWGERIIISDLRGNVKIESNPILKTVVFDKGKNRENVLLIKNLIKN